MSEIGQATALLFEQDIKQRIGWPCSEHVLAREAVAKYRGCENVSRQELPHIASALLQAIGQYDASKLTTIYTKGD